VIWRVLFVELQPKIYVNIGDYINYSANGGIIFAYWNASFSASGTSSVDIHGREDNVGVRFKSNFLIL
jgi:hypothetical protein